MRLREFRERAGLSMNKVSDLSGLSRETVRRLEGSDLSRVQLGTLFDYLRAVNVSPEVLADSAEACWIPVDLPGVEELGEEGKDEDCDGSEDLPGDSPRA